MSRYRIERRCVVVVKDRLCDCRVSIIANRGRNNRSIQLKSYPEFA